MPKAKKQCIIDPFAEFRTTQAAEVNMPPLIDDPTELANEEVKEYMKMKCSQETPANLIPYTVGANKSKNYLYLLACRGPYIAFPQHLASLSDIFRSISVY